MQSCMHAHFHSERISFPKHACLGVRDVIPTPLFCSGYATETIFLKLLYFLLESIYENSPVIYEEYVPPRLYWR